jgi:hypothetical protein
MINNSHSFAEVLSSNLTSVQAQCWNWQQPPVFGSLVTIQTAERTVFGIVSNIIIESSDPVRQPVAYQKTEAELLLEQPQIFEFLQTTFHAIIVGHQENKRILYHLPPSPPRIHSFVSPATKEMAVRFFERSDFLHLLTQQAHETAHFQELLFAIIKQTKADQILTIDHIYNLLKEIIILLKIDYAAQKIFITRVETLLQ